MHAYIITGGTPDDRSEKIASLLRDGRVATHDTITVAPEGPSIGVNDVRGVASRLSIHPVSSPCHAVVLRDAHAMTIEAQNAFLKTLEEPAGDAMILLETDQPDALLPTILSRCHVIRLSGHTDRVQPCQSDQETSIQCLLSIERLLSASMGEHLKMIDTTIKTRDDALSFVNQAIQALEQHLLTGFNPVNTVISINLSLVQTAKLLRRFLTARSQLLSNITPKLALDVIFLS